MAQLTQHTINTPYMIGPIQCYTATLGGELVLFDTGPPTPQAREYLQNNIDLDQLKHVLITHCHIDHYGQAHWLERATGAKVYLPYKDCLKIREHDRRIKQMYHLLASLGFTQDYLEKLRKIFDSGALFPPSPKEFLEAETDLPKHLQIEVIPCPGHSQSDLVYAGSDWAVTGDTLLRGVFQSPILDVDLETGERFNNYQAYCKSLIKLASLKRKNIFPAHRYSIESVDQTIVFYVSKLLRRATQLQPYQGEEKLLFLIDKLLGGRMTDIFHIYLKASEILFMKDLIKQPQLLKHALMKVGLYEDVADLYQRAVSMQPCSLTGV